MKAIPTEHLSIRDFLLNLAGLTHVDLAKGVISEETKATWKAILNLQTGKANHYGDYYTNITKEDPTKNMLNMQLYSEAKRKWVRIQQLVKDMSEMDPQSQGWIDKATLLVETYSDLCVYSQMSVHALTKFLNLAKLD